MKVYLKSYMIDIYVALVQRGIRKIDEIPSDYLEVVAEKVAELEEAEAKVSR